MSALAWPAIQLGIALAVIGVVIGITGAMKLQAIDGEPLDVFGLGLVGDRGLARRAVGQERRGGRVAMGNVRERADGRPCV